MDITTHLRHHHGAETLQIYRLYERRLTSAKKLTNQIRFLKDCIEEQVIPKMFGHVAHPSFDGSPFPEYARAFLLDQTLEAKSRKEDLLLNLRHLRSDLRPTLPDAVFEGAMNRAGEVAHYKCMAHKRSINRKLVSLCNQSRWEQFSNPDSVIVLTNSTIDKDQRILLSLGLSFSLGTSEKDLIDSISRVNNFNYYHPEINANFLKGVCLQAFGCGKKFTVLPKRFQTALSNLANSKDIKIMKADKGGAVVVMDTIEYNVKAMRLLHDKDTYTKVVKPPTISTIQTQFNRNVRNIVSVLPNSDIKNNILSKLTVKLPSFSYFYGTPKVHKTGVPLRPIIATCGSPQSYLAKWLANNLSPLLGKISNSHLVHSMDFLDRLRKLGPVSGKLISLDVTALFTNVPLEFVLDNLKHAATSGIFSPPIPIAKFCELIKLCVDATIFVFDGEVYQQKFGVAMGSPLSPILANLCMEFLERNYIQVLPDNIKPILWVRYVDDIFIIYQHDEASLNRFLTTINNLLPTIKFTVESEEDGKLPFLDVLVIHNKDTRSLSFKVYRKPTNSENYIHYYSHHSPNTKANIVTNMFSRALKICDPPYLDQEIDHILLTFKNLGYPQFFLRKCLSRANRQWYNPRPPRNSPNHNNYLTLPFSSEFINIQKSISNVNTKTPGKENIDLAFKYSNTLRNRLVRNNSKINDKKVGVYCIPCLDCSLCYIGESGRSLPIRLEEHKRACRLGSNYSAVASHSLDVGHRIGFKQSQIVYNSRDRNTRRTVEGALISLNNTFANNKSGTKEDKYINSQICKTVRIKNYCNISATLCTAASSLSSQVSMTVPYGNAHDTGAYDATPEGPISPEPPDMQDIPNDHVITRRSSRLRNNLP